MAAMDITVNFHRHHGAPTGASYLRHDQWHIASMSRQA